MKLGRKEGLRSLIIACVALRVVEILVTCGRGTTIYGNVVEIDV